MKATIKDYSDVHENFIPGTRIILDGVDVSDFCYRAEMYEDGTGAAFRYKQRDGHPYQDRESGDVAREVLAGKVEIVRPSAPAIRSRSQA